MSISDQIARNSHVLDIPEDESEEQNSLSQSTSSLRLNRPQDENDHRLKTPSMWDKARSALSPLSRVSEANAASIAEKASRVVERGAAETTAFLAGGTKAVTGFAVGASCGLVKGTGVGLMPTGLFKSQLRTTEITPDRIGQIVGHKKVNGTQYVEVAFEVDPNTGEVFDKPETLTFNLSASSRLSVNFDGDRFKGALVPLTNEKKRTIGFFVIDDRSPEEQPVYQVMKDHPALAR